MPKNYYIAAIGDDWDGKPKHFTSLKKAVRYYLSGEFHGEYPKHCVFLEQCEFSIPQRTHQLVIKSSEKSTSLPSNKGYYVLTISEDGEGTGGWEKGRHSLKKYTSLTKAFKNMEQVAQWKKAVLARGLELRVNEYRS